MYYARYEIDNVHLSPTSLECSIVFMLMPCLVTFRVVFEDFQDVFFWY